VFKLLIDVMEEYEGNHMRGGEEAEVRIHSHGMMSTYAPFLQCRDNRVNPHYCICDEKVQGIDGKFSKDHAAKPLSNVAAAVDENDQAADVVAPVSEDEGTREQEIERNGEEDIDMETERGFEENLAGKEQGEEEAERQEEGEGEVIEKHSLKEHAKTDAIEKGVEKNDMVNWDPVKDTADSKPYPGPCA